MKVHGLVRRKEENQSEQENKQEGLSVEGQLPASPVEQEGESQVNNFEQVRGVPCDL